ncbi:MAG TPA: ParB N-terminal domain-containing protein [Amycolatopsis sp.]|uniref:ParB N-terminal domain-containing protein n=1 Tax=Amycolatopsis sp. TaxID=37632 RepID=UPI002B47B62A|nr:ParB N-terminal domain-containing protein [Amycolatopsis sp.]HKS43660.1 ParB N-terminal domain-containing protein [Amycolatopsis sp.]
MDSGQSGQGLLPVVVEVPVSGLSVDGSPRTSGVDPEHVKVLASVVEELPPIIVHRPTMWVIDGAHRLAAAKRNGRETIAVTFFEGDANDAFVLAVRTNIGHGKPLSIADRKRAAERIMRTHPDWSTRRMVATAGISSGTVDEIRRKIFGVPAPGEVRIGKDGKVRPVDPSEGRRIATELITADPGLSLRRVARAAGLSPETVRRLRQRLRCEESPAGPADGGGPVRGDRPGNAFGATPENGHAGPELAAAVEQLKSDPALRFTVAGRALLRLLHLHLVRNDDWARIVESIPPRNRGTVALLARQCAVHWSEFGVQVEEKDTVSLG